jgi:hypothetical protein
MSPALFVIIVAVAAGFLAGGGLRPFERVRMHWWGIALAGLALQALPFPSRLAGEAVVASYVALLTFVAVNRRAPGAILLFVGLGLNLAVIGANGGMPVDPVAVQTLSPVGSVTNDGRHHVIRPDEKFAGLGDVIPLPPPIKSVVSPGDLVLYAGLAWYVLSVMLGRSGENPRPPARVLQMYRGKHEPPPLRFGRWSAVARSGSAPPAPSARTGGAMPGTSR